MNERRRPPRRGRGPRPAQPRPTFEANDMEVNPYRDDASALPDGGAPERENGIPAPDAPPVTPAGEPATRYPQNPNGSHRWLLHPSLKAR